VRDAEPSRDRGGGERIGRRDDRAECERARPRQILDDGVRDEGHARGRCHDEADREHADVPHVGAQVA
jgi:hypothetical protein